MIKFKHVRSNRKGMVIIMTNAKLLLISFAEKLEKILIEFNVNEENALSLMKELKKELEIKHQVEDNGELFDACVYNALATINTVPGQNKKSGQLIAALVEAKDEIKAIAEFM